VVSDKSVAQKLGIKPGFCIFIDGAPSAYGAIVGPLPATVTIEAAPKPSLDMVHLFAMQSKGLAAKLRRYRGTIAPDGMIWEQIRDRAEHVGGKKVVREHGYPDQSECSCRSLHIWHG